MYSYISGTVAAVKEDCIILDNSGIGYRIFMPSSALDVVNRGMETKVYTFFSVREDAMQLFGFLSEDDLEIFKMLIGVSGIGPKGALAVLGVLSADDLRFAVLSDDAAAISKAPGIGKKTAQKVIIELRDRLNLLDAFEKKAQKAGPAGLPSSENTENEAVLALTALGYTSAEALKAVRKASEAAEFSDTSKLVSAALREMI